MSRTLIPVLDTFTGFSDSEALACGTVVAAEAVDNAVLNSDAHLALTFAALAFDNKDSFAVGDYYVHVGFKIQYLSAFPPALSPSRRARSFSDGGNRLPGSRCRPGYRCFPADANFPEIEIVHKALAESGSRQHHGQLPMAAS